MANDLVQDSERANTARSIIEHMTQLQGIARQAASISIDISNIKAVMANSAVYTTADKARITSLEKIVTDPAYTAFITLIQTGVV